jgi:predicted RNA binding protein YcfA (HicA-like mRNA interferase family)
MSRAPRLTGDELVTALESLGFSVLRIKGSHHFLRHADGRCTVVPVHSGEIIGPGLLRKILRDCQLGNDELRNRLKR